jgi:hypothetical protein
MLYPLTHIMLELQGEVLPIFPYQDLVRVTDILYYDGPLITQFKRDEGEHFIYYWCDNNDTHNRWMIYQLTQESLDNYFANTESLYETMQNAVGGCVVFVDISGNEDKFEYSSSIKVDIKDIPEDYLPEIDSFLN